MYTILHFNAYLFLTCYIMIQACKYGMIFYSVLPFCICEYLKMYKKMIINLVFLNCGLEIILFKKQKRSS